MIENRLEKRMYFLVMYNLSDIQKGIQAGHAAIEYANLYSKRLRYKEWAVMDKTFIILNGGTSNDGYISCFGETPQKGTMQEHLEALWDNGIETAEFREPDANSALTAIAFLVDERVFNHEDYPDFADFCKDTLDTPHWLETFKNGPLTLEEMKKKHPTLFKEWLKTVGGEGNAFLKYFLRNFRLA